MKFKTEQTISLGENSYIIKWYLEQGAIVDTYLATPQLSPDYELIIKTVRHDKASDPAKIEAVRREAKSLAILNKAEGLPPLESDDLLAVRLHLIKETESSRHVIALVDSGEIEGLPVLVQEKAPPKFEQSDIFATLTTETDMFRREQKMLPFLHVIAQVMLLAHKNGLTLNDFDPRTKMNRVRLAGDDTDGFNLKIINWYNAGLDGRENITTTKDMFWFGCLVYYLCLGHHLPLGQDEQPPAAVGIGVLGWDRLTVGVRQIMSRLLHVDPSRRYTDAAELVEDIAWWIDTLHKAGNIAGLQDRVWDMRSAGRYDRALAVANLALRLNPPAEAREIFTMLAKQAGERLQKVDWVDLTTAKNSLLAGEYNQAADEFAAKAETLPPESKAAFLARIYKNVSLAGNSLKLAYGLDIRVTLEWRALSRGAYALADRKWRVSQDALYEMVGLRPAAAEWPSIQQLQNLIEAGLMFDEAVAMVSQTEPDYSASDWGEVEQKQIEELEEDVKKLEAVCIKAPSEPNFYNYLKTVRYKIERRKALLDSFRRIENHIKQGVISVTAGQVQRAAKDYQAGFDELLQIMDDPNTAQYRVGYLLCQLQTRFQELDITSRRLTALSIINQAITNDEIDRAIALLADDDSPAAAEICRRGNARRGILHEEAARIGLERQAWQNLKQAGLSMQNDPTAAERLARQLLNWPEQSPDGFAGNRDTLIEMAYQYPPDLLARANITLEWAAFSKDIEEIWVNGAYDKIAHFINRLEAQGIELPLREQGWLEEAEKRRLAFADVQLWLSSPPDNIDELVMDRLEGDNSSPAWQSRMQAKEIALTKDAQDYLTNAAQYLQAGDWTAFDEAIAGLQSLQETPYFRVVPDGVDNRYFQMSLDMHDSFEALRGQGRRMQAVYGQIETAMQFKDWTTAVLFLKEIAVKRDLTSRETAWLDKAHSETIYKKLNRAKEAGHSFEVIAALQELGRPYNKVEQLWFDEAHGQLKQNLDELHSSLTYSSSEKWPVWFEGLDFCAKLHKLSDELLSFRQADPVKDLQQQAENLYERKLVSTLSSFLKHKLEIQKQDGVDEILFLQEVLAYRENIPDFLYADLPPDIDNGFQNIKHRLMFERIKREIVGQLVGGHISFQEATESMQTTEIKTSAAEEIPTLEKFAVDLNNVAGIERELGLIEYPPYALAMSRYLELRERLQLSSLPDAVTEKVNARLLDKISATVRDMSDRLQNEVEELNGGLSDFKADYRPDSIISLSRQAAWIMKVLPADCSNRLITDMLNSVVGLLFNLQNWAAKDFCNVTQKQDYEALQNNSVLLTCLATLNDELARSSVVDLPPLSVPLSVKAVAKLKLPSHNMLYNWKYTVDILQELLDKPPIASEFSFDGQKLADIFSGLEQIKSTLELAVWPGEHFIERLQAELTAYYNLSFALDESRKKNVEDAVTAIAILYEQINGLEKIKFNAVLKAVGLEKRVKNEKYIPLWLPDDKWHKLRAELETQSSRLEANLVGLITLIFESGKKNKQSSIAVTQLEQIFKRFDSVHSWGYKTVERVIITVLDKNNKRNRDYYLVNIVDVAGAKVYGAEWYAE